MKLILILSIVVFTSAATTHFAGLYTSHVRKVQKRSLDTNHKVWETNWPDGVVPYEFNSSVPERLKKDFECAINEYHAKTCIQFVPRNGQRTYCSVGYDPKQCGVVSGTELVIGDSCRSGSLCEVLLHEIGHILGYAHEQDRWDRDNYIRGPGLDNKVNFETFCIMYDYVSIEHYKSQCTVHGGLWEPILPGVQECGGGSKLSVLDVDKLNACYNCKGCLAYRWMGIGCFDPRRHQKVEGGYNVDGTKFYVCRGWHHGDIIPGKGVFRDGEKPHCYVGHFGYEYKLYEFEVLTNPNPGGANLQWLVTPDLPLGAIAGGRVTDRTSYYIGRCFVSREKPWSLVIGKIYANDTKKLIIPFGGKETGCATKIGYLACQ